jgi:hypothetical protein
MKPVNVPWRNLDSGLVDIILRLYKRLLNK